MKLKFVQFIGCLLFFSFCNGQVNLYVSAETGSDSNTGLTPEDALKSIGAAIEKFDSETGGMCYILAGTYHEELTIERINNITFKAFENDFVVIDGTVALSNSNWNHYKDGIYELQLPQDQLIWQLFIDDKQQVMARWPNAQFFDDSILSKAHWAHGENGMPNGTMKDMNLLANSGFSNQDIVGALAIANIGSFRTWVVPVETADIANGIFTYPLVSSTGYRDKHQDYYFEKKLVFLDAENEWFFDVDTHKVYVYGNPNGKKIQAKTQSYFMEMNKVSGLVFEDLNFFGTTISAFKSSNITLRNCRFSYPSCSKRMLGSISHPATTELSNGVNNTANFVIEKCLFEYTDGEAFYLEGADNTITNNYIHHIDYSCASLRGLGVTIVNKGVNCVFKNNTVHTTSASSTLNLGDAPKISFNDISNTGFLQNDGSLIQLTRTAVEGSTVHHNWLHHSVKSGMRYDAPINDPSVAGKNGLVHHNVIWNINKALMIKGNNQMIYNNTCFNNSSMSITILNEEGSNSETITKNNLADNISGERNSPVQAPGVLEDNVFSNTATAYGVETLLRDPGNFDFRPKTTAVEVIGKAGAIPAIGVAAQTEVGAYGVNDNWVAGASWTPDMYPWTGLLSVGPVNTTKKQLKLFPNPCSNTVQLNVSGKNIVRVFLLSATGKALASPKFYRESGILDMEAVSPGVYCVLFEFKDGSTEFVRLVKK